MMNHSVTSVSCMEAAVYVKYVILIFRPKGLRLFPKYFAEFFLLQNTFFSTSVFIFERKLNSEPA